MLEERCSLMLKKSLHPTQFLASNSEATVSRLRRLVGLLVLECPTPPALRLRNQPEQRGLQQIQPAAAAHKTTERRGRAFQLLHVLRKAGRARPVTARVARTSRYVYGV